jgi:hypothetical protein
VEEIRVPGENNSAIFSSQFYWWRKPAYLEKITQLYIAVSFIGGGNQSTWRK